MTDRSRPGAALILAAGEGTRMRSAVPKVLHPIGGRGLLGHAVHAVAELDPEHLVVVLGHGGDQVREAVTALGDELARPVTVAVQEQQLGTGHAVRCGLDALPPGITGPVLVTYGDVPLLGADTLADAAGRAHDVRGGGHAGHHRARRPHRLRPRAARDRRHRHPDRRAGRRDGRAAGGPRGQLGRLRVRRRVPPRGPRAAVDVEQPGRAVPHRPHQDRARRRRRGARRDLPRRVAGARRQRPRPARRAAAPS